MKQIVTLAIVALMLLHITVYAQTTYYDYDESGNRIHRNSQVRPIVSTAPITEMNALIAKSGGNIVSDGGAPVTARGICWSTSPNPIVANNLNFTSAGSGSGAFTCSLSGLVLGSQYYVRAYATNNNRLDVN